MREVFNKRKLPKYTETFGVMTASIVGVGAVGTHIAEKVAQMGIGELRMYDFDTFSEENSAKHAGLIDPKQDVGRNKAIATAERVQPYMVSGGPALGFDADVRMLGPEAFRGTHVLFVALDNYAAKVYLNQIWLQIPLEERPVMIFGGTEGESAQSHCIDGSKLCMRCMFDESWLIDGMVKTSCTGAQYYTEGSVAPIVRTSGLASNFSALYMCEHFRAWALDMEGTVNTSITYYPFPNLKIEVDRPMHRKSCPDCGDIVPEEKILPLEGDVMHLTLSECLEQIRQVVGEDFYLEPHRFTFNRITYSGILVDEYCHCCGKPAKVHRHEGLIRYEDVLCDECRAAGNKAVYDPARPSIDSLKAILPGECPEELLPMTLYELGWTVGGYLRVIQETGFDFLDSEIIETVFTCSGDREILKHSGSLQREG